MAETATDTRSARRTFFKSAFGANKGYLCLSFLSTGSVRHMHEEFFFYPNEMEEALDAIEERYDDNVYYCPQLFIERRRSKNTVKSAPSIWADLDTCSPDILQVRPTLLIESSPGRFQALWVLEDPAEPEEAQDAARRLAYFHASDGCDRSGWDLSQLLRVPTTYNYKYDPPEEVRVIVGTSAKYRLSEFDYLPPITVASYELIPMPEDLEQIDATRWMKQHASKLDPEANGLFYNEPEGDWSAALFRFCMFLFEIGTQRDEVFQVAQHAACNKFKRDGRPLSDLWRDVCRVEAVFNEKNQPIAKKEELADLLTRDEREYVRGVRTFVEDYIDWASKLGDAAVQYHQAGAFVILSALLAGRVHLATSFGKIVPNLWFMILADTTLTRKSTAMDLAIDLLSEVDDSAIMATDGSIEGLMQGLSLRPGKPSIFLRDEFSGLLEMMTKKDYYAGMAEALTKLYDGKMQKRLLRKETIEVREPCLITFAGGIRNRVQQLLSLDHISSGFVPRFVFVTAVSDVDKVQPLGPPTELDTSGRTELLEYLADIKEHYHQDQEVIFPDGTRFLQERKFQVELNEEAWKRFRAFEKQMLEEGVKSERSDLMTPVYSRLSISTLKAIILLAACRQKGDKVIVELDDVLLGIRYCYEWREYALEVINGVGKSVVETDLERILANIQRHPGISRSTLMRNYHLTARTADTLFMTLEQRGLVTVSKAGSGSKYFAVGSKK